MILFDLKKAMVTSGIRIGATAIIYYKPFDFKMYNL
jgi:hypothetical protein